MNVKKTIRWLWYDKDAPIQPIYALGFIVGFGLVFGGIIALGPNPTIQSAVIPVSVMVAGISLPYLIWYAEDRLGLVEVKQ